MEKAERSIKGLGLFLLSITWCALQTVVGALFAFGLLPTSRAQRYRGMILIYHPYGFTFSLGTFAFVSNRVPHPRTIRGRMYGHYLQSLLYGPVFFFVVSCSQLFVRIPAVKARRAERDLAPSDVFADRQALRLAEKSGETQL